MTALNNALLKLYDSPTGWKMATIIMIKNPAQIILIHNIGQYYRPISLLSYVSKIFEKLIHSRLISH